MEVPIFLAILYAMVRLVAPYAMIPLATLYVMTPRAVLYMMTTLLAILSSSTRSYPPLSTLYVAVFSLPGRFEHVGVGHRRPMR